MGCVFSQKIEPWNVILDIQNNKYKSLERQLKSCEDISVLDSGGYKPLETAIRNDYGKCVDVLCKYGFDCNKKFQDGVTPLDRAINLDSKESVYYLLKHGADVKKNKPCLSNATYEIMKLLIEAGVDPNNISSCSSGTPILHTAASKGNLQLMHYLASLGADMNVLDTSGRTALFDACLFYKQRGAVHATSNGITSDHDVVALAKDCIEYLLHQEVSIDHADLNGQTSIYYAILYGDAPVVKFFLEKGVNINIKDNSGRDPIEFAKMHKKMDIVEMLKKYKAEAKVD
eukprot:Nk52_evm1s1719 gene=Nk52_evmTU1s1719